jgi:hypothetical protein
VLAAAYTLGMRLPLGLALVLSLAPACSEREARTPPTAAESLEYPTFEIFRSSRMFDVMAGDLAAVDLAEMARESAVIADSLAKAESAAAEFAGIDKRGRPSAELQPSLPEAERPLYCLLPVVMMVLEPLWTNEHWSEAQVEAARNAAAILGRVAGAPKLHFEAGKDAENRAGLEAVVRWFRATASKPECLAAMIFTMDDGPYVGDTRELRLARTDREPEAWVMQCVRGDALEWSRVVSGLPDGEVARAEFYEDPEAEPLGAYGWHVPFWVDWPAGEEQAHLYLDANGKLLFYYLSW